MNAKFKCIQSYHALENVAEDSGVATQFMSPHCRLELYLTEEFEGFTLHENYTV